MSEDKHLDDQLDNDPERTLVTLEQLSQTIEVMTSVVNRLRQHLSEQLKAQIEDRQEEAALLEAAAEISADEAKTAKQEGKEADKTQQAQSKQQKEKDSFVIEIRQQDSEPVRKNNKTLH